MKGSLHLVICVQHSKPNISSNCLRDTRTIQKETGVPCGSGIESVGNVEILEREGYVSGKVMDNVSGTHVESLGHVCNQTVSTISKIRLAHLTPRIGKIESIVHNFIVKKTAIPRVDSVVRESSYFLLPEDLLLLTFFKIRNSVPDATLDMTGMHFGYEALRAHWGRFPDIVKDERCHCAVAR